MSTIKQFKSECLNESKGFEKLIHDWSDLHLSQHRYGSSFAPIYKLFRGHWCPNCQAKLSKSVEFTGQSSIQTRHHTRFILTCDECEYEFAYEYNWR